MSEKTISKYIDALSKKLGVAAEHIYSTLYKQAIVMGIVELICGAIMLVGLVISIRFVYNVFTKSKYEKKDDKYYSTDEPINTYAKIKDSDFVEDGLIWYVAAFVWIVMLVIIFIAIPDGLLHVLNPNYYSLKEILDTFKG
ncbi:hypothetical protein [Bacillus sp. FJAT-49736]|uniref:hypothetical protein n=1 Tax=Bacillus sp. FJAT-49736 TaxID=2833582 RepID=UPI001BC94406|nr:hypothetical protein [Bacillus sp. FJAT-49736]MBS4173485.1 hypothetical protein [Bacillus sp. FJAT-49736]